MYTFSIFRGLSIHLAGMYIYGKLQDVYCQLIPESG